MTKGRSGTTSAGTIGGVDLTMFPMKNRIPAWLSHKSGYLYIKFCSHLQFCGSGCWLPCVTHRLMSLILRHDTISLGTVECKIVKRKKREKFAIKCE